MTIDPMTSYRTARLVATREELYHVPEAACVTYYFSDLGLHVFKYGTPRDAALAAIELDSDTFQRSDEFIHRGGIIARMRSCLSAQGQEVSFQMSPAI